MYACMYARIFVYPFSLWVGQGGEAAEAPRVRSTTTPGRGDVLDAKVAPDPLQDPDNLRIPSLQCRGRRVPGSSDVRYYGFKGWDSNMSTHGITCQFIGSFEVKYVYFS